MEGESVNPRTWVVVTVLVAVLGCLGVIIAAAIGILPDIGIVPNFTKPEPTTAPVEAPPPTSIAAPSESLSSCPGLGSGETRTVPSGTYIIGDIVIDGVRQHDWGEKEGTIAFLERESSVYAEWGAGCWQGSIDFMEELTANEFTQGCGGTGCNTIRQVIVRSNGQQDVQYLSK